MNVRHIVLCAAVAFVFAVAFWGLDRYAVNNIDDFGYSLVSQWQPTDDGGYITRRQPVASFADALASQRVDYIHKNGRFLVHTLTQWFCGAAPMSVFAVCNSIAFGAFLLLLSLLTIPRRRLSLPRLLIVAALTWLLCRTLMMMSLGAVSAAVNYLWTAAATLAVVYAFERLAGRQVAPVLPPLLAIGGAIAGSMQEGFSIGLSTALIIGAIVKRRQQNAATLSLLFGYLLGTAVVTLAPANFARTAITGLGPSIAPFKALAVEPVIIVAVATLIIAAIVSRRQTAGVLRASYIEIVTAVVATAFACFGAFTGAWQLIVVHVMALIVLLRLLDATLLRRPAVAWTLAVAATCLTALTYSPTLAARSELYDDQQHVYDQALSSDVHGIVDISDAVEHYRRARQHPLWCVFGDYVGFNLRALVNDNQRCACPLLSAFVTRGQSLERVEAVIPAKPSEIERICRTATTDSAAVPIAGDFAVVALDRHIDRDSVLLDVTVSKRNSTSQTTLRANQTFDYNGSTYYIFTYNDYDRHVVGSRYHIK